MADEKLNAVLVGCGYWGKNLLRNIVTSNNFRLVAVVEPNRASLDVVKHLIKEVKVYQSIEELTLSEIDAAFIATPATTHYSISKEFIMNGIHVWVEKPLALKLAEVKSIFDLCSRKKVQVFVDYTFIFNSAVRKIKDIVDSGELGVVYFVNSIRQNFGIVHKDVDVIWDLAVHDFAIYSFIFGNLEGGISSHETLPIQGLPSVASSINFQSSIGPTFQVSVNWLSPEKLRKMTIIGSEKSLVYDDTNSVEPIKIYDRSLSRYNSEIKQLQLSSFRYGDVYSPIFETKEALSIGVMDFADKISRNDSKSVRDMSIWISKCLEASKESSLSKGKQVLVKNE
jgi:predicted dehydrogenase